MKNGNIIEYTRFNPDVDIGLLVSSLEVPSHGFASPPILLKIEHVIAGLDYLHSEKVVHGDLKGVSNLLVSDSHTVSCNGYKNNVLIDDSGCALLSDFGRAQVVDENQSSSVGLNTAVHWTAPEVLTTEDDILLSYQSDVWSLGITMFEVRKIS